MEGLKALKNSSAVELCLLDGQSLLGAKEHVEFSTRAIVHTDSCVSLILELELLLNRELGEFTVLVCSFS